MLETLKQIDYQLLLWINGHHTVALDGFMFGYSQKWVWLGLYIAMVVYCIWRWRLRAVGVLLAIIAAVGISDFVASGIIKHLVCRLRPTHQPGVMEFVNVINDYRGGQYGFVSSHAANTISLTLLFALLSRDKLVTIALSVWCLLNVWSRMYLGVHYPGDIIGGFMVGSIVSCFCYAIYKRISSVRVQIQPVWDMGCPPLASYMVVVVWLVTTGILIVSSVAIPVWTV
ncbi:MAG: phosphatase PAP2 family protein [Paludibacteraceae bacterium]|nr:phosphatase PAP2 family protein [Paludibacteraceae bacterium]